MSANKHTPMTRANAVAAENYGIISRDEALGSGLTGRQIEGLVRSGQWVIEHPGVYRVAAVPRTWTSRVIAAIRAAERCPRRDTPRVAVASHMAAAVLHGLRPESKARPEITVVGSAKPLLDGVVVHRTATMDSREIQPVRGIPATTGARMDVDLCGKLPDRELLPLVDDSIVQRVTTRPAIYELAVALRPGRPFLTRLTALVGPDAEGTFHSFLERSGDALIHEAGLPKPQWNVAVYDERGKIGVVDAYWEDVPLIVEFEGLRFHTTPTQRQRDAERFNRLTLVARVLRFTYRDILERPDYVIESLRDALPKASQVS